MFKSLRSRLLVWFVGPALVLFLLIGAASYLRSERILEDELGRSLISTAAIAASELSPERLVSLQPGDDAQSTRTYKNLLRPLTEIQKASGARRIIAFDPQGRVLLDSQGTLPIGADDADLARDRLELQRVFAGERVSSQVLFRGTDGRSYKTGYAPILREGAAVAAVAVDGDAAFYGPLRNLYLAYAGLAALGVLALGAIAGFLARSLGDPLRRLMQAALRMGGGDLSTPVAPEPTEEIGVLSRELEAMRQALDSRDRQLKMMLAGVAHEVRNPLGGIELFAGLAAEELQGPAQAETRSHVARIQREVDYLRRIVDDFLAFAKDQKLSLAPTQAGELLESARELIAADAAQKQVTLRVDAVPATLQVDHSLVLAALVNLVKNAVQASPAGQTVELRGRPQAGGYRVEVSDAGPGIPAEVRERIFEPFFTTREKGTGLGLPLARKIFQAHRGSLEVESAPGATVFRVNLPEKAP